MTLSQTLRIPRPVVTLRAAVSSRPMLVDTLIALSLSALSIFTLMAGAQDLGTYDPVNLVLLMLQTMPLAFRRVWPAPVFVLTYAALVIQALIVSDNYFAPIGSLIALYTVGQRLDRRRSGLITLAAGVVFLLVMLVKNILPAGLSGLIQTELTLLVVWTLGTWSRERQAYLGHVEERAARLEREREARDAKAVAEERERIARELHDVVTHHVSVIVIQAGAGQRSIEKRPDEARRALAAIDS